MANATAAGWSELNDVGDQVLAVSAMFGMFQVKRGRSKYWPLLIGEITPAWNETDIATAFHVLIA